MGSARDHAARGRWTCYVGGIADAGDPETYTLDVPVERAARVMTWLRALVDGYAATDDVFGRLTYLDAVRDLGEAPRHRRN
jgi:hypothetical protein